MDVISSNTSFDKFAFIESWHEVEDILGGEAGFVALEDADDEIRQGDYRIVNTDPEAEGIFFEPALFGDERPRDERHSGGFFFRNWDKDPVELKYRFSDELRDYPELIHTHNVPELYVADGRFEMDLATKVIDGVPQYFENVVLEDSALVVPPGMYHGITYQEDGSNLVVARGDPHLNQPYVGKWDMGGEQLYNHFKHELKKPEPAVYQPENDEMYRL